ncbi:MAG: hypothetical protein KC418_10395 [Anaerolineales bacterium]|nr:hypothetical protein [Anaerolineales bacterium]MCB8953323.1 hypothetical protein [Ardenticatenales bacterium]
MKIDLRITVNAGPNTDTQDTAKIVRELEKELRHVESVLSIDPVYVRNEEAGQKGVSVDFGALLVALAEGTGLAAFITVLGQWLGRDRRRSLKLQIGDSSLELTGLSSGEQQELVRWFQTQTGMRFDA